MRYIPSSERDRQALLEAIGRKEVEELFASIPEELRCREALDVPGPFSEAEIRDWFEALGRRNADPSSLSWFIGGGAYRHEVSCIVDHVLSRAEFATAYTPYQPEIAQGTLQAIFEFQTLICQLTGCEVANASLYDGAHGVAEAGLMALRLNARRKALVVARSLHPHHRAVLETYCRFLGVELRTVAPAASGRLSPDELGSALDDQVAAVLIQSPNFLGVLEDVADLSTRAHDAGALLAVSVLEPTSLGVVQAPGALGADIVTGEAACFAHSPTYGGPWVGFFASSKKNLRNLPGRIAGQTVDQDGKRGFVLTLATREQHIRRERATSNICTNQGLIMLAATVGMCLYGRDGLRELSRRNLTLGEELKRRIAALPGWSVSFTGPTYNEMVVEGPEPASRVLRRLRGRGIVAGPALAPYFPDRDRAFLLAVTERNKLAEIDALIQALSEEGDE